MTESKHANMLGDLSRSAGKAIRRAVGAAEPVETALLKGMHPPALPHAGALPAVAEHAAAEAALPAVIEAVNPADVIGPLDHIAATRDPRTFKQRALEHGLVGAATGGLAGALGAGEDRRGQGAALGALGGALAGVGAGEAGHYVAGHGGLHAAMSGMGSGGALGLQRRFAPPPQEQPQYLMYEQPFDQRIASVKYHGHTFPGYNKPIVNKGGGKHKMKVLAKKGDKIKLISFGHRDYNHNYSAKAKANYLKRSAGIKDKSGKLTKNDKLSANYWARSVLWPKGPATGGAKKTAASLMELLQSAGPTLAGHTVGGATLGGLVGGLSAPDHRLEGAGRGALLGAGLGLASGAGSVAYKGLHDVLPHQLVASQENIANTERALLDSKARAKDVLTGNMEALIAKRDAAEALAKAGYRGEGLGPEGVDQLFALRKEIKGDRDAVLRDYADYHRMDAKRNALVDKLTREHGAREVTRNIPDKVLAGMLVPSAAAAGAVGGHLAGAEDGTLPKLASIMARNNGGLGAAGVMEAGGNVLSAGKNVVGAGLRAVGGYQAGGLRGALSAVTGPSALEQGRMIGAAVTKAASLADILTAKTAFSLPPGTGAVLRNVGGHAASGAAVGALGGAIGAEDGHRLEGALRGGAVGGALGGTMGAANLGIMKARGGDLRRIGLEEKMHNIEHGDLLRRGANMEERANSINAHYFNPENNPNQKYHLQNLVATHATPLAGGVAGMASQWGRGGDENQG